MMSKEEVEVVKLVYNRFIDNEGEGWSGIDDILEMLEHLTEAELIKESRIKSKKHAKGIFRCTQNHKQEYCFAPYILEAVQAIIGLYESKGDLHPKNAYILSYYLAMTEMKMIFSD